MTELRSDFGERTINELCLMFRNHQINLEPGFQRQSVWTLRDRRGLIQSILSAYPVPGIPLYKRSHRGKLDYDVIDGKQRLETIFMFTEQGRFRREAFDVKLAFDGAVDWYDWRALEVTGQLKAAGSVVGIALLDHIIFNRSGYFSFLEAGRL